MKRPLASQRSFSLIELAVALGIAGFCLIAVLGMLPVGLATQQNSAQQTTANQIISQIAADLRADVRLPAGLASKEAESGFGLHGHWKDVANPDTLFFTNDAKQTGSVNPAAVPVDAVFRAKITYIAPPTDTTSLASIRLSWPAAVDPDNNGVSAGSVQSFIATNR